MIIYKPYNHLKNILKNHLLETTAPIVHPFLLFLMFYISLKKTFLTELSNSINITFPILDWHINRNICLFTAQGASLVLRLFFYGLLHFHHSYITIQSFSLTYSSQLVEPDFCFIRTINLTLIGNDFSAHVCNRIDRCIKCHI